MPLIHVAGPVDSIHVQRCSRCGETIVPNTLDADFSWTEGTLLRHNEDDVQGYREWENIKYLGGRTPHDKDCTP